MNYRSEHLSRARYVAAQQVLQLLYNVKPKIFTKKKYKIRPLALGILTELIATVRKHDKNIKSQAVYDALKLYTCTLSYHIACIKREAYRVGLKNERAGPITDKQRRYHIKSLKNIKKSLRDAKK